MGIAYADMDRDGSAVWMGARGGAPYEGPFKCAAQREMEAALMARREPGHQPWLTECCHRTCRKQLGDGEAELCTQCRSVVYCSKECQAADWTGLFAHKERCGTYLPPESTPYVSRAFSAYREHWGRFPTAKPSAAQRASDAQVLAEGDEDARLLEEQRRAYLRQRGLLLQQMGLGELAGELSDGLAGPW